MRVYLSVGIEAYADITPLDALAALTGISIKISEVGSEGRRWLSIQGDVAEDKLHQIVALVNWD